MLSWIKSNEVILTQQLRKVIRNIPFDIDWDYSKSEYYHREYRGWWGRSKILYDKIYILKGYIYLNESQIEVNLKTRRSTNSTYSFKIFLPNKIIKIKSCTNYKTLNKRIDELYEKYRYISKGETL